MNQNEFHPRTFKFDTRKYWEEMRRIQRGFRYIIAIDVETTGLNTKDDEIIQVGGYRVDAKTKSYIGFQEFFKPNNPIPPEAYEIHRISNDFVKKCKNSMEAPRFIASICNGKNLVIGYNIHNFDFDIILRSCQRYTYGEMELPQFLPSHSLDLFPIYWKDNNKPLPSARSDLKSCHLAFTGEQMMRIHDAKIDAFACIKILPNMVNYYKLPKGRKEIKKYIAEHPKADRVHLLKDDELLDKANTIINEHVMNTLA
jgi:DNA polymerase III epsilon subunit-like protein